MENASNRIIALLGPTNTGKTHVAIDKMFNYESGIFGLPLRLLAREIYDKCLKKVGSEKVALIERLRSYFDETSRKSLLERRAQEVEYKQTELRQVPYTIYIG